jgi:hypothetical protein
MEALQFRSFLELFAAQCQDEDYRHQLAQAYNTAEYDARTKWYGRGFKGIADEVDTFFAFPSHFHHQLMYERIGHQPGDAGRNLLYELSGYSRRLVELVLAVGLDSEILQQFWSEGVALKDIVHQPGQPGALRRHVLSEAAVWRALDAAGASPELADADDDVLKAVDLWAFQGLWSVQVKASDHMLGGPVALHTAATKAERRAQQIQAKHVNVRHSLSQQFRKFCYKMAYYNHHLSNRQGLLVVVRREDFDGVTGEPKPALVKLIADTVARYHSAP